MSRKRKVEEDVGSERATKRALSDLERRSELRREQAREQVETIRSNGREWAELLTKCRGHAILAVVHDVKEKKAVYTEIVVFWARTVNETPPKVS